MRLVSLPDSALREAWGWLQEYPECNFDDAGPRTFEVFRDEVAKRRQSGELIFGVELGGELCGLIGVNLGNGRVAMFHGICFAKRVHGQGVASQAVRELISNLWEIGYEKVQACFFADNGRVHEFLLDLGAIEEGYLRRHTVRGGRPLDMRLVAFYKES